jgi:hypothetical protein
MAQGRQLRLPGACGTSGASHFVHTLELGASCTATCSIGDAASFMVQACPLGVHASGTPA